MIRETVRMPVDDVKRSRTKYSQSSWEALGTCHPKLQALFIEADLSGLNITIIEGRRGKERQNKLYNEGKSELKYPESMHNERPSLAVDAQIYLPHRENHLPWDEPLTQMLFAGQIDGIARSRGIDLRIGVDWDGDNVPVQNDPNEDFFDAAHFELEGEHDHANVE
jgi:peptidoglycan L-alanyl-D-glutamate endopeptidase CwlK